ncbi:hypothetical protein GQ457_10G001600 [Hibiscus cannabinus]
MRDFPSASDFNFTIRVKQEVQLIFPPLVVESTKAKGNPSVPFSRRPTEKSETATILGAPSRPNPGFSRRPPFVCFEGKSVENKMSHHHLSRYIRKRNQMRHIKSKLKRYNTKMMDLVEQSNQLREKQIKNLAELKLLRRKQKRIIAHLKRSKTITVQTLDDMHNARRLLACYDQGWSILVDAEDEETRFFVHIVQSIEGPDENRLNIHALSQMRVSEASAHNGSFSARIKEEPSHLQTNIGKEGQIGMSWISSTAIKAAADATVSACPTPYEKRQAKLKIRVNSTFTFLFACVFFPMAVSLTIFTT